MTHEQYYFAIEQLRNQKLRIPTRQSIELYKAVPPDFPIVPFLDVSELFRDLWGERQFLLGELKKHIDHGCTYPYLDNATKQEYIDYLKSKFPLEKFPQMYPPEDK